MSQRLACDAADLFAAAAPMAFPLAYRPATGCQPSRSMPVLTVMGLTDMLVRYDGRVRIGRETFDYWREVNGCGAGVPELVDERGKSRCEYDTAMRERRRGRPVQRDGAGIPGEPDLDGHVLYLNPDFVLAGSRGTSCRASRCRSTAAPAARRRRSTGTDG